MFLDSFLVMCDTLTVGSDTAVIASTSYIDTLAKGDDYAGCFANFLCESALTSATASAAVTFALQHSDSTAATSFVDLVTSGSIDDAITVAGYRYQTRIPGGTKRYIRATGRVSAVVAGGGGTFSAFITKDSDMNSPMVA